MIRRFEIYAVAPDADDAGVSAFESACARCGRFIPEVLHSAVGWNRSDAPVQMVWEHAFASAEAYQRYMVHPYHADVLDRYLLADSPERVVVDDGLGAGLVGYSCDGPVFAMAGGLRRLVLLRLSRQASTAQVNDFERTLAGAAEADDLILSVVGANTLGSAWFDAVTPVGGRPRWTHLWEQGFVDTDGLASYRHGPSSLAEAERRGWQGVFDGVVERAVSLYYEIADPRPERG